MANADPLRTLLAPLQRDLEEVETFLHRVVGAGETERTPEAGAPEGAAWLAQTAASLLSAGGKRVRPALVLLSAHAGSFRTEVAIPAAAAVELLHLASLVHDDVIDQGDVRRGLPTVNARWGGELAVLMGDYLFGRALAAAAFLPRPPLAALGTLITRLATGEVDQLFGRGRQPSLPEYLDRVGLKTASMLSTCCQVGAAAGDVPETQAAALVEYGWWLGLSYQLVDDLLDLEGDPLALGKPVGMDARTGVATLPAVLAAGWETALLEAAPQAAPTEHAVGQSWAMARDFSAKAVAELDRLERAWVRSLLRSLAVFVVDRRC